MGGITRRELLTSPVKPLAEPRGLLSPILRYFGYAHLPQGALQDVSRTICGLAVELDDFLPDGPEKSVALRKLLETKDAAVRSALDLPAGG